MKEARSGTGHDASRGGVWRASTGIDDEGLDGCCECNGLDRYCNGIGNGNGIDGHLGGEIRAPSIQHMLLQLPCSSVPSTASVQHLFGDGSPLHCHRDQEVRAPSIQHLPLPLPLIFSASSASLSVFSVRRCNVAHDPPRRTSRESTHPPRCQSSAVALLMALHGSSCSS